MDWNVESSASATLTPRTTAPNVTPSSGSISIVSVAMPEAYDRSPKPVQKGAGTGPAPDVRPGGGAAAQALRSSISAPSSAEAASSARASDQSSGEAWSIGSLTAVAWLWRMP